MNSTRAGREIDGCADNIVGPGDLVEVVITETSGGYWTDQHSVEDNVAQWEGAGAGEHWGCTDPGP